MKKTLKFLALFLIVVGLSTANAQAEFWAKNASQSLVTNDGSGYANADIHVRNCYIGLGTGTPCGGGGGGGLTNFSFTNANGFSGTVTNPTSTPNLTLTTFLTSGSVPFIGASGALSEDNAKFSWDNSTKYLGVGIKPLSGPFQAAQLQYSTGTASQSGTTITGVGTTWTDLMVGNEFVFANGSFAVITARVSNTVLTTDTSQTISSQAYGIYHPGLLVQNATGDVLIGAIRNPSNNSRLFVYGGNTGANIDARGTVGINKDISQFEAEGNDYDTNPNSIALRYFGSTATGSQTVMGYPSTNLGVLDFTGNNNSLIRSNTFLRFGGGDDDDETMTIDTDNNRVGINNTAPLGEFDAEANGGNSRILLDGANKTTLLSHNGGDDQIYLDGTNHQVTITTNDSNSYVQSNGLFSFLNGTIRANAYGAGIQTGTPATYPAFDASGNIIESTTPYDGVPALPSTQVAFGDGNNLLAGSDYFTWDGTGLFITGDIVTENPTGQGIRSGYNVISIGDNSDVVYGNKIKIDDANSLAYYDNISHDGKFGINTTTPRYSFDVIGSSAIGSGGNYGEGLFFVLPSAGLIYMGDWNTGRNGNNIGVDDTNNLAYYVNSSNNAKFGINAVSPSAALDVNGDIYSNGVFTLGDTLSAGIQTINGITINMGDFSNIDTGARIGVQVPDNYIYANNSSNTALFGINTATPDSILDVQYQSSHFLKIDPFTSTYSMGDIDFANNGTYLSVDDMTQNVRIFANRLETSHIKGSSATPTITAGTGAGTSSSVAVIGSDLGGHINITTGSSPSANADVATITFSSPYTSIPRSIILTPANSDTAALVTTKQVFVSEVDTTTTTFLIRASPTTALSASTAYKWYYQVIQ